MPSSQEVPSEALKKLSDQSEVPKPPSIDSALARGTVMATNIWAGNPSRARNRLALLQGWGEETKWPAAHDRSVCQRHLLQHNRQASVLVYARQRVLFKDMLPRMI